MALSLQTSSFSMFFSEFAKKNWLWKMLLTYVSVWCDVWEKCLLITFQWKQQQFSDRVNRKFIKWGFASQRWKVWISEVFFGFANLGNLQTVASQIEAIRVDEINLNFEKKNQVFFEKLLQKKLNFIWRNNMENETNISLLTSIKGFHRLLT